MTRQEPGDLETRVDESRRPPARAADAVAPAALRVAKEQGLARRETSAADDANWRGSSLDLANGLDVKVMQSKLSADTLDRLFGSR
jgi:hypothetical protein